jgi:hypothetical protein
MKSSTMNSRGPVSRRSILRGAGVCLALPFLESLAPRELRAAPPGTPLRLIYWHIPNGVLRDRWDPEGATLDAASAPASLASLAEAGLFPDVNVLTGVDNLAGVPSGPGDHASGMAALLTCVAARKSVDNYELGISVDQVAAKTLGALTPRASLELGMSGGGGTGDCDNGYGCAYAQSISWTDAKTPRTKYNDAKKAWTWLLGNQDANLSTEQKERMRRGDKTLLDYLVKEAGRLSPKLTAEDRQKLEQYLTSVQETEKQLTSGVATAACQAEVGPENSTAYQTRMAAMLKVMEFAVRCDLTRVITFSLGNAFGPGSMPWIDVGDFHGLTHNIGGAGNRDAVAKCIAWEVEQIAAFASSLKQIVEGEHNALYNTALMVGSEVGEGAPHDHERMPCLIAGNAGGAIATGRHLRYSPEDARARQLARSRNIDDRTEALAIPNTNRMANLHLALLQAVGVPATQFADSNQPIAGLLST